MDMGMIVNCQNYWSVRVMTSKKRVRTVYTEEMHQFIRDHYLGISTRELTAKLNEEFGTTIDPLRIRWYKNNHKLWSGYDGEFQEGHTPHSKGKKWDEFMSAESQDICRSSHFQAG